MSRWHLDGELLWQRLDRRRVKQGLTWRGVARELELSPSTFARLKKGHHPDTDALVTMLVWLDLDTDIVALIAMINKKAQS